MSFPNTKLQHTTRLVAAIECYRAKLYWLIEKLTKKLELADLSVWRAHKKQISGKFSEGDEWYYQFHGTGCVIYHSGIEIDFEFDIDGSVGGVDLWRLWVFICDNEVGFEEFRDKKQLELSFNIANEEGSIVCKRFGNRIGSLFYIE